MDQVWREHQVFFVRRLPLAALRRNFAAKRRKNTKSQLSFTVSVVNHKTGIEVQRKTTMTQRRITTESQLRFYEKSHCDISATEQKHLPTLFHRHK